VGGRHEPPTGRSFYISLATSTLRAIILGAAVILGIIGLTKAFPNGGTPVPVGGSPSASPTPSVSPSQPSPSPSATPRVHGVSVQVLNGSHTTGLAATASTQIRHAGYHVLTPGNANPTSTTVVYYQAGFQLEADFLKTQFFPSASVRPATQAANSEADLTVILGTDYSPSGG
jgi:hypothetical protein